MRVIVSISMGPEERIAYLGTTQGMNVGYFMSRNSTITNYRRTQCDCEPISRLLQYFFKLTYYRGGLLYK